MVIFNCYKKYFDKIMQGTFKNETSFDKRLVLSRRIRNKYPDSIPIIVESIKSGERVELKRKKFLAPKELSILKFLTEVRSQTTLSKDETLFILCGSEGTVLVPTNTTIEQLDQKFVDQDGFLYMVVALENTFGAMYILENTTFSLIDKMLNTSAKFAKNLPSLPF